MKFTSFKNARIVRSGWLEEGGRRLDCNPYMSGALEARDLLHRLKTPTSRLADLTSGIFDSGRESRHWVDDPKHGVAYMGTSSIGYADLSMLPMISKRQVANNPRLTLQLGSSLITRSGTVGKMAYVRPGMVGMTCSEDVLRVVPNEELISPGYLYAFLTSKFGVPLVIAGTYGAIIQHIEAKHIAGLPVPRLGNEVEQKIHSLIEKAASAKSEGQAQYEKATEEALRLTNLENLTPHIWHTRKSIGFTSALPLIDSLRALNHEPRMVNVLNKIRSGSYSLLGDLLYRQPFRPNRFNRIDAKPGYGVQLIGQREMFHLVWNGRWISWMGIPLKDEVIPPASTIAVACIGTLGEQEVYCRSIRIRPGQSQFALSDNVLQLRINKSHIPPGYLFALLRSETYFRIFRCLSVGGKQQVLHPERLHNIPIPLIETKSMEIIDELVCNGDYLLDLAVELEQQATKLVEQTIEEAN